MTLQWIYISDYVATQCGATGYKVWEPLPFVVVQRCYVSEAFLPSTCDSHVSRECQPLSGDRGDMEGSFKWPGLRNCRSLLSSFRQTELSHSVTHNCKRGWGMASRDMREWKRKQVVVQSHQSFSQISTAHDCGKDWNRLCKGPIMIKHVLGKCQSSALSSLEAAS